MHPPASRRAVPDTTLWQPKRTFALLAGYFGLFGMFIGVLGVLWAPLVAQLRLTESVFGMTQLVSPLVAVAVMSQGGRISAGLTGKAVSIVGLLVLGASIALLGQSTGLTLFVVALAISGLGNAFLEIGMNGTTLEWERASGRSVMNLMHAGFSAGATVGALMTGILLDRSWTTGQVLWLVAGLYGLMSLLTISARFPPQVNREDDHAQTSQTLGLLRGNRVLQALAAICLFGIAVEGLANQWSGLHINALGGDALVIGTAFSLFNAAMFIGRLLNTVVVARTGPATSLWLSGIGLALAGVLLLVPNITVVVVALTLMGLSVAGIVPTVLSAAAQAMPGNSGATASVVMAVSYIGFIVTPVGIGWIAEWFSLSVAFGGVILMGLAILALIRSVRSAP